MNFRFGNEGENYRSRERTAPQQDAGNKVNPKAIKLIVFFVLASVFFIYILITFISFVNDQVSSIEPTGDNVQLEEQRMALASNPNDIDALTNLGNSFYSASQYDSALKYYNRVLELDSKNYSGLFNKGLVYFQWADYPNSIELFRKCNSLYPESMEVHNMLGDCYYSQNNYNEAIRWYQQAYDKGTRNSAQLNIMAYIYDTQNRTGDAIKYYKEALEQDSSLVDVYTRLAELEPSRADWYNKKAAAWK
jgi:tetratricopeptide (TPR) repeat protein